MPLDAHGTVEPLQQHKESETPVHAFQRFLTSEEYFAWRFNDDSPADPKLLSVLDVIEAWLKIGDGLKYCSSYEQYLLVVIDLLLVHHSVDQDGYYTDARENRALGRVAYWTNRRWSPDDDNDDLTAFGFPFVPNSVFVNDGFWFGDFTSAAGQPALQKSVYLHWRRTEKSVVSRIRRFLRSAK